MCGVIHKALRELAIDKAGEHAWREIAKKCKPDGGRFIGSQQYSGEVASAPGGRAERASWR